MSKNSSGAQHRKMHLLSGITVLAAAFIATGSVQAQPSPRPAPGPVAAAAAATPPPARKVAEPAATTSAAAIPGVCIFSRLAAIGNSKAGLAATIRMQQIASEISADLNSQRQAISVGTNEASVIQQRLATFSQLEQLRGLQLQRTKAIAEQEIGEAINPLFQPVVTKSACSVVFDRGSAYSWNPAMDITPQIVQALDEKLPSIQVNLVLPETVAR